MSTPTPAPQRRAFDPAQWLPSRRSLLWVLLAFVAGLVLFALVMSRGREEDDFYRPGQAAPPTAAAPRYEPLPAPLPAQQGGESASGLGREPESTEADAERPRLVEAPKPPPPPAAPPAPAPTAAPASLRPEPIAGQTPAPSYPARALRRGESGTVMVRAEIRPDGTPGSVTVATSSGSRQLDRAAVDAVKRWRFRPALSNGQPTSGTVMVPISFEAQR